MHIVFVQPLLPKYSISFFNRLSQHENIKITVLADILCDKPLNQYKKKDCYFNVVHLEEVSVLGVVFRPDLKKLLTTIDFDCLILNGNPRDCSQLYILIQQWMKGCPAFTWGMFHRIGGNKFISECYYRIAGKLSNKCFTYSKKGINSQLMRGVDKRKLIELGTAIDEQAVIAEKNSRTASEIDKFKSDNNLNNRKIILQVVRLSAIKKPYILIEAAKIVVIQDPLVLFVIIGGGDLEEELKNKVLKHGLSNNMIFLGPVYDERILSFWFLSADVFVIPSCIGLSAHHAMCYGIPIITDNDYIHQASEFEILFDGLNSSLYEADNACSLANKINELLSNENYRQFLSSNAFYTVTKISSLERKVTNLLTALRAAIN